MQAKDTTQVDTQSVVCLSCLELTVKHTETPFRFYCISLYLHYTEPTFKDKYTALLQQELQNPYWCLHDPIATKSYQISSKMDIKTMPHAMYFTSNKETFTKINQVPYQQPEQCLSNPNYRRG